MSWKERKKKKREDNEWDEQKKRKNKWNGIYAILSGGDHNNIGSLDAV